MFTGRNRVMVRTWGFTSRAKECVDWVPAERRRLLSGDKVARLRTTARLNR
jgi:hypothetical protein